MTIPAEGIIGVVIGVLLGLIPSWLARRRRSNAHGGALRAEISQCRQHADTFLKDKKMAPLYRLPVMAFQASLPALLADGALQEAEVATLSAFYSQVQDLNRGLGFASDMAIQNDATGLKREYDRNLIKAKKLVSSNGGQPTLYDNARAVLDDRLRRRFLWIIWCRPR